MRPYDAWTEEESLICAVAMFIYAAFGIGLWLDVINGGNVMEHIVNIAIPAAIGIILIVSLIVIGARAVGA